MAEEHLHVLLVDDDEDEYVLTQDLLSDATHGIPPPQPAFELEWVDNYETALQAIGQARHDVCLIDYRLGDRDGLDLLRTAIADGCTVPIIILTGQGDYEVDVAAMRAGAADYLEKGELSGPLLARTIRHAVERRRVEDALHETEQLLRRAIDAVPGGIFIKDRRGNFVAANKFHAAVYGTTPEQMVGTNERDYAVFPDTVVGDFLEEDREVIDTRQSLVTPEIEGPRADGTTGWFYTVKVPLTIRGDPDHMLGVAIEVTERVRAERALREAEEQLQHQERLAAIGQLAGGIAHDFNNYLTVIILGARVALRNPNLPPDLRRTFETTIKASRRAATLVQQLLDFSRRSLVDVQPLDLGSWLQGFSYVLRRTLPESIEVGLDRQGEDCMVCVDQGRIQQALLNLATNARDAMPEGGNLRIGLSRVSVGPDERAPLAEMGTGDWVCLTVSDTGIGMTEDVRSHLFEPFFTTKEVGQGTGLGLAQVYGIVKQHQGHIDVDTEPGQGTTFRIYLPPHYEEREVAAGERPAAPQGNGETILLVEDEDNLRDVGREILSGLGYDVLTAAHGREALEVFGSAQCIDLVVTDMVMPQMGGKALMRELRCRRPAQKGLIITGYALQEDAEGLGGEGFIDTIPKPFDADMLATAVRSALDAGP